MIKLLLFIFICGAFLLVNVDYVIATNGCDSGDPECGSIPTANCDVTQDTTFTTGTYDISHGVDICANDITLDCNGALLKNPDLSGFNRYGISLRDFNGALIKNCKLNHYQYGIRLWNSSYNTISENNGTFAPFKLYALSANNIIKNNYLESAGGGIILETSYLNRIEDNLVIDSNSFPANIATVVVPSPASCS